MRSPVPTITDDQLDDIQVQQNADRLLALHEIHYDYAQQLDAKRRRDIAKLQQQNKELLDALVGLVAIAADSTGVAGYHLNGAIAEWGEFEEVAAAIKAIAKATGGQS